MWIHAKRDPAKERLQMRYCATAEEVEWVMKYWQEEWKIPFEQAKEKHPSKDKQPAEVSSYQTKSSPAHKTRSATQNKNSIGESAAAKKKTIPKPVTQQKNYATIINASTHKKDNIHAQEG
jgi:hypothetical protein